MCITEIEDVKKFGCMHGGLDKYLHKYGVGTIDDHLETKDIKNTTVTCFHFCQLYPFV